MPVLFHSSPNLSPNKNCHQRSVILSEGAAGVEGFACQKDLRVEGSPLRQARVRDCGDSYGVFELPLPEDRAAIQSAIGEVLQRLACCALDPKRAGLLLYDLQIASCNLPKAVLAEPDATPIERIVTDPTLGRLAPRSLLDAEAEPLEEEAAEAEPEGKAEVKAEESTRPHSIAELKDGYYRALDRLNKQRPEQGAPTQSETAKPAILPNLQASISPAPPRCPFQTKRHINHKPSPSTTTRHLNRNRRPAQTKRHLSPTQTARHLDRSRAASSRGAVERPCISPLFLSLPAPSGGIAANRRY